MIIGLPDPRPDADVARRHDHDVVAQVCAAPDRRAARHDAPRTVADVARRYGRTITERQRAGRPGRRRPIADPFEDRELDLRSHPPTGSAMVGSGSAARNWPASRSSRSVTAVASGAIARRGVCRPARSCDRRPVGGLDPSTGRLDDPIVGAARRAPRAAPARGSTRAHGPCRYRGVPWPVSAAFAGTGFGAPWKFPGTRAASAHGSRVPPPSRRSARRT